MEGLYMLGTGLSAWKEDSLLTIVFQLRTNCDALDKSDPECDPKNESRLTWETAKRFADYVLSDDFEKVSGLIVEFTEAYGYAEVSLMDRISEYFKDSMVERNQKLWFRYHSGWEGFQLEEVWRYLKKNEKNIEVEIILDNFLDVKDSVICLWEKGVAEVLVHMEAEEEEKETQIFEEQLRELADYAIENQLFRRCRCNFFEEEISGCLWEAEEMIRQSRGVMVVPGGNIYSFACAAGCSFERREKWMAGSVEAGVDPEGMRPFSAMPGYDGACRENRLRGARIRANEYYFAQLFSRCRIRRRKSPRLQRMFIPLEDFGNLWRCGRAEEAAGLILPEDMLEKSLKYCEENGVEAVLLHPADGLLDIRNPRLERIRSVHVVAEVFYEKAKVRYENVIPVWGKAAAEAGDNDPGYCSLLEQ